MPLSKTEIQTIETTLKNSLRYKFQNYKPEPAYMPFHTRLLGKDRLALYFLSIIAIPYNPYEPEPYERWTLKGMLDLDNELKVAEEFWDFLGGDGAYSELLNCFERVGIELRPEIDEYFSKFK